MTVPQQLKQEVVILTTIIKSSIIHFPLETVWQKIRDFNALPSNHPAVLDSRIEDDLPSDHVGCIRCFHLKQGGIFRERLITLDNDQHVCAYTILEAPIPVQNYIATIRLLPNADSDSTLMEWTAEFECDPQQETALKTWVGDVFQDGFGCLHNILSQ